MQEKEGARKKGAEDKKFIPGVILEDEDEIIYYEMIGDKCSRCPLRGLCG